MERKVLFTASTESHIRNFHLPYLERFRADGWIVHVGCGGVPSEIPFADRVLPLPFEKKLQSPSNFRAAAMLRREIKQEGYTLIITHTSLAAFFTRLAVKGMKRRPQVINVAHGFLFNGGTDFKTKLLLGAEKLVARQTDLLLVMNQWDLESARQHRLAPRIDYIPGIGVEFERRCQSGSSAAAALRANWKIKPDAFVLFYAAEFSSRKNQSVLLNAMTHLPEQVVLVLAGQGDQLESCVALAQELGLNNRVIFPGYVNDVATWYKACNAAVTSSRSEGLPFNVMEAMYCELPVVASAVKGHTDLIEDGVTGLLYPCDDPEVCAKQINRLLESESLCSALGRVARNSVLQYDLLEVLPTVMEQYQSVLPVERPLSTV